MVPAADDDNLDGDDPQEDDGDDPLADGYPDAGTPNRGGDDDPLADGGYPEEDLPRRSDDDDDIDPDDIDFGQDDDGAARLGGGGEDDEFYEEGPGRPFFLNPVLLASLALLLLVGAAVGWGWATFNQGESSAALAPPRQMAALPPPPMPPAPEPAIGPAPADDAASAGAVAAGAAAVAAQPGLPGSATATATAVAATAAASAATESPPEGEAVAAAAPEPAPAEPPPPPVAEASPPPVAAAPPAAEPAPEPEPEAFPEVRLALAPAPDPELVTEGENGPLPVIAPDGRQPWRVYARPFELPPDTPRIAIIIGGLGLSRAATQAAIQQLPGVVTLAFVPYAPNLDDWIAAARAAGHEVVLQLPMEPQDYPANDPGPHTLLASADAADNLARLDWLLSRFTGYVGVTNYMGGLFNSSPDALRPIFQDLSARGLLFLDSRENPDSVAAVVAAELEMPRVINNRFLDAEASRMNVDARLLELERIAESTGAAVGIGFPYPVTIERVAAWIRELESKGVVVAPITAVASTQPVN